MALYPALSLPQLHRLALSLHQNIKESKLSSMLVGVVLVSTVQQQQQQRHKGANTKRKYVPVTATLTLARLRDTLPLKLSLAGKLAAAAGVELDVAVMDFTCCLPDVFPEVLPVLFLPSAAAALVAPPLAPALAEAVLAERLFSVFLGLLEGSAPSSETRRWLRTSATLRMWNVSVHRSWARCSCRCLEVLDSACSSSCSRHSVSMGSVASSSADKCIIVEKISGLSTEYDLNDSAGRSAAILVVVVVVVCACVYRMAVSLLFGVSLAAHDACGE